MEELELLVGGDLLFGDRNREKRLLNKLERL